MNHIALSHTPIQLYFDSEFFATSYALEEPFFGTLPCNKNVLLPIPFHLLDSFKTHKGYCHICQFGEHLYS